MPAAQAKAYLEDLLSPLQGMQDFLMVQAKL
jgi:hypothetical protein